MPILARAFVIDAARLQHGLGHRVVDEEIPQALAPCGDRLAVDSIDVSEAHPAVRDVHQQDV